MEEKLKIVFSGQFTLNHSYGPQGLAFPFMEKFDKKFKTDYTFLIAKKHYEKNKKFVTKNFKIASFNYPLFFLKNRELLRAIKNSDIVIDVDGIEFIGNRSFARRWFHFFRTTYIQWLAKRYNKLYIKSAKSYGPFPHRIFKFMVKRSLNKLPFLFVRGKNNLKEIKKLNLKIPVYSFPDTSIILEPTKKSWAKKYLKEKGLNMKKPVVGISPSAIINNESHHKSTDANSCGENHTKLCKKLINFFQSKNIQVLLIPHSITNGKDLTNCDLALSKKIYNELDSKAGVFLLSDLDLMYKDVRSIIGMMDFYITGRYHGLASSLAMGIPTVSLSWHIKYKDLNSLFFDKDITVDCRKTNVDKALEKIQRLYLDRKWFNKLEWKKRKKRVVNEVNKNIEIVLKEIKKWQKRNLAKK